AEILRTANVPAAARIGASWHHTPLRRRRARDFPLRSTEYAMATACFVGFPASTSRSMFRDLMALRSFRDALGGVRSSGISAPRAQTLDRSSPRSAPVRQ